MSVNHREDLYRDKIKSREQLRDTIGPRPRKRKVIMCHGTFDLVHPGHIRHLMYAKSKADILVASLTCDAYIEKAHYRPFVPQTLRAMNLAALEIVDYVLLDDNETPLENIGYLEPDYFAKGYEYFDGGIHPKTDEEVAVLNSYGGEVIFTPGDVVFSSSAFIELARPNLSVEKLMALMESEKITFDQLKDSLARCQGKRVHVLGDTIVDTYAYCNPIGSSTSKTPTLAVKYDREQSFAGGAAIVSRHLKEAGAEVVFTTVLGDDSLKDFVLREMETHGVVCCPEVESSRVTTQKNVFIADGYRVLKVDKVDNRPISSKTLTAFASALSNSEAEAFVFSDFSHGIFSKGTTQRLISALPDGPLRVADSQVASRWGNILDFRGFDLITPNEKEARFALGDQDSVIRPLALELYRRARCKALILKMGDRGVLTYREPSEDVRAFFTVDSFAGTVTDPVGAGDALLAYSTLVLVATGSPVAATILASMAAAVACEHDGNTPVSPSEVLAKLDLVEKQVQYA